MAFAMASANANLGRPATVRPALPGSRAGMRSARSMPPVGPGRQGGVGLARGRGGRMRVRAKEAGGVPVEDGEVEAAEGGQDATVGKDGEELPPVPPRQELSQGMKDKLRTEYIGIGGSETQAMGGNYFLYIAILVVVLAAASKLTGAI